MIKNIKTFWIGFLIFRIGFIIEAVFQGLFKVESGFRFVSPFLSLYYIYTTTKKYGWNLDFLTLKSKIRDRWDHLIAMMGFESLLLIVIIGSMVSLLLLFGSDALMAKLESLMAQFGPEEKKFSIWIMMDDFLAMVLLGPLMEEILFRGFLYDGIKHKGQKYTMILSVLAFGLAHGGVLPHHYISGYIYTKLRQQNGDIYGGLILHSFNNFLVFMAGMITLEYLKIVVLILPLLYLIYYRMVQRKPLLKSV